MYFVQNVSRLFVQRDINFLGDIRPQQKLCNCHSIKLIKRFKIARNSICTLVFLDTSYTFAAVQLCKLTPNRGFIFSCQNSNCVLLCYFYSAAAAINTLLTNFLNLKQTFQVPATLLVERIKSKVKTLTLPCSIAVFHAVLQNL